MLFDTILNNIVFVLSLSDSSLLANEKQQISVY